MDAKVAGSCDVSLGARHLQGRSRRLSVAPGALLPLGAALGGFALRNSLTLLLGRRGS